MLFATMSAGIVGLVAMQRQAVPIWAWILLGLMVAGGGLLSLAGFVGLLRGLKFGRVHLDLEAPPMRGGWLAGHVEASIASLARPPVSTTLTCYGHERRPRAKGGSHTVTSTLGRGTASTPGSEIASVGGGRVRFPVRVEVPAMLPPTGHHGRTRVEWRLQCHADLEGLDFIADFPIVIQ
jgi:hypothetical protein